LTVHSGYRTIAAMSTYVRKGVQVEEPTRSLSEVAGAMGVSERTVRRWIKSGRLKAYKPGRDYHIPEAALRQFIDESEVRPKEGAPFSPQPTFNHVIAEEERRAKFGSWAQPLTLKNEAWLKLLEELPDPPDAQESDCGKRLIREVFDTVGAFITGLKNYGVLDDVQRLVEAKHAGTPVPSTFDEEVSLLHGELGVLINRVIPKARNWYTRFEEHAEMRDQLESMVRVWKREVEAALAA
jgi:excisionase family DNA binding protein